jgi:hypothetical protein
MPSWVVGGHGFVFRMNCKLLKNQWVGSLTLGRPLNVIKLLYGAGVLATSLDFSG